VAVAAHLLNHRIEPGDGGTGPPIPSSAVSVAPREAAERRTEMMVFILTA
jgi:hypothetical protein